MLILKTEKLGLVILKYQKSMVSITVEPQVDRCGQEKEVFRWNEYLIKNASTTLTAFHLVIIGQNTSHTCSSCMHLSL